MLGHMLVRVLGRTNEVFATVRGNNISIAKTGICDAERVFTAVDALDSEAVERTVKEISPDVLVNAVGVIKHRDESKNKIRCIDINSVFPHRLAALAREIGARFVTFSTDCVFKGDKGAYEEEAPVDAEDVYGQSKALGEVCEDGSLTIRTSIIGRELKDSGSLVEWVISNRGGEVNGYANAMYSGFTTLELSRIVDLVLHGHGDLEGLYHVSSEPISKFELIGLVSKHFDLGIAVRRDEEFVLDRTLNSDRFRNATGYRPKTWPEMIKEMAADAISYEEWRKLKF